MWKIINKLSSDSNNSNYPSGEEFYEFFYNRSQPELNQNFDYNYEKIAIEHLKIEQNKISLYKTIDSVDLDILNRNFTEDEISCAITKLKRNKTPGHDCIQAEFLKHMKSTFTKDLTLLFNYMIEQKQFPDDWAEGLRNPIFKAGTKSKCTNYRGITILPVFGKVFETVVLGRLEFVSDAFQKNDRFNGGFKKGCRPSDNNFIIQGLVNRQLSLGRKLIVIHVDFSRAFDLINRNILFYKLQLSGYKGRVIDTLFNMYMKTCYRVKHNGKISNSISENIGVNQGGVTSPFLFREYLSDLKTYLDEFTGICIKNEIR